MNFNKKMLKPKKSGRNTHRFLIKEAYKIFSKKGYSLKIEYRFTKERNFIADIYAENENEKVIIECLTRPTLSICEDKQKYKKYCDRLVLIQPNSFVTTFPTEDFFDEVVEVEVPNKILDKKTLVQISEETWNKLVVLKCRPSQTFDDIINILFEEYKVK